MILSTNMKYLTRIYLFNLFGLWFTSQIFPGLVISSGWQVIILAGLVLSLLMILIKPLLKILFIPINLLTFGLLSWLINVIVIYLLTIFVIEVKIIPWIFSGTSWLGFVIPKIYFNYNLSLIITSLLITFFTNLLHKVSED